ncbi:MAG TPA: DUF5808 domain-containing protein [Thermoanaerobaculia bacterium]|nr:DUF5808 domain-containing protein [Thermoanaerobaculia bacterium]
MKALPPMTSTFELTAVTAGILVLVAVLAYLTPGLTRPDLFFAVTVPASFRGTPEARDILRRYRAWVVIHSLIALGLGAGLARINGLAGMLAGIGLQQAGWFLAYYRARRRVTLHATPPTTIREAELRPRTARLPGGWVLQIGPFAALLAAAVYLRSRWADLPERFPVHWGLDGQPDRWATRSLAAVDGPLLIGAVVSASLVVLSWLLLRQSRQIRPGGLAGLAEHRFRHAVLSVLLACEYLLALIFTWTSLVPLSANVATRQGPAQPGEPAVSAPLVLTLLFVVAVAAILIRLGQGGTRLAGATGGRRQPPGAGPVGDRSPDRCWKAGVIYVNPDDPALFVEKRFGLGYTMNFGRPAAWVILALFLLVPLALSVWLVHAGS